MAYIGTAGLAKEAKIIVQGEVKALSPTEASTTSFTQGLHFSVSAMFLKEKSPRKYNGGI